METRTPSHDAALPVRDALDRLVAHSLPPVVLGLSVAFLSFGVAYGFLLDPAVAAYVAAGDVVTGLACAGLYLWIRRDGALPPRAAQPVAAGAALLAVCGLLYSLAVVADPGPPLYFMLVFVGAGLVLLSWQWLLVTLGVGVLAWSLMVLQFTGVEAWFHLALYLAAACVLSVAAHAARLRAYTRIARIRRRDHQLKAELRQAMESARESETLLRAVVTSAPVVLFAVDRNGTITLSEGRGLESIGYRPRELVGENVFDRFADVPLVGKHFRRAFAGETFAADLDVQGATYEVRYAPLRGSAGDVAGVMGVAWDITERKQAERQLAQTYRQMAQREKLSALGTLVAGVAHEINNPLAAIKANLELAQLSLEDLRDGRSGPAGGPGPIQEAIENGDAIMQNITRIEAITGSLKRVARASDGSREAEDVNGIVESALTVAKPRLRNVTIHRELGARTPGLVNANEMSQVLLNLLINAGDAVAEAGGGDVTVRTRDAGDRVVIEVADTGPGIPKEKAHEIFTPFFTTKSHGTGLGLSISYRIVEEHGGRLSFTCKPGGGTTFRVELPAAGDAPDGAADNAGATTF